jgi:acyl-CoA dehydrogenase
MRQVVNDAMDVQGGSGICMGPRNLLGRVYQAIPISITVEGANILTRSLIIFGQGAVRCHPYVFREMQAVANDDAADFDRALFGHLGFAVSNAVRSLLLGLGGASLAYAPVRGPTRRFYKQLARMSAAFALSADVSLLVLGGSLKRREKLSGRLADTLSWLYLASAALKRFEDQGRPQADLPLVQWACEHALHQAQQGLDGLLKNFPNRPVAWLLRRLVFPLGRPYHGPSDRLGHQCAALLLAPSEARDRLTRGLFVPTEADQPLARLEKALDLLTALEPVEKKVREAQKNGDLAAKSEAELVSRAHAMQVISDAEYAQWVEANAARREAVAVDDFEKPALVCHAVP